MRGKRKMSRARKKAAQATQGVELIEQVIAIVARNPQAIAGFCGDAPLPNPRPMNAERLATLTFPSGAPLPPSLKRWLAFDMSWLAGFGWFDGAGNLTPRRIDEIVTDEFDQDDGPFAGMWGNMYAPLVDCASECFLLPGGSDSRRIFAVTAKPDRLGEYPVLVVDIDDMPYAAVMYPGFDVFMGDEAGMPDVACDWGTYEELFDDPRYGGRMRDHAKLLFHGRPSVEMMDEEWGGELEE
jgi:hypothetical protein